VSTRALPHRGDLRGEVCQRVEQLRQPGLIGTPGRRREQAVRLALEQRHAEPRFEQMHHPADRRGGDVQLVRSLSKASAAGGGFERLDTIHEGKLAHRTIRIT
jgi:hypothetical protein